MMRFCFIEIVLVYHVHTIGYGYRLYFPVWYG